MLTCVSDFIHPHLARIIYEYADPQIAIGRRTNLIVDQYVFHCPKKNYRTAIQDQFGDILIDVNSKGSCQTWQQYYNYLTFMVTLSPHKYEVDFNYVMFADGCSPSTLVNPTMQLAQVLVEYIEGLRPGDRVTNTASNTCYIFVGYDLIPHCRIVHHCINILPIPPINPTRTTLELDLKLLQLDFTPSMVKTFQLYSYLIWAIENLYYCLLILEGEVPVDTVQCQVCTDITFIEHVKSAYPILGTHILIQSRPEPELNLLGIPERFEQL